ncbi:Tab2/Atab2 family RNA-binding protein [Oculatella sp. FACHB-28]|uniref:Tab2/Atab2 family RNA-binding protein n=1 Tax=Oculatella sp. FACHB-28 TaxID=2692845 RepID=UPI001684F256|nr:Tab2/Atab2 family RNA-binding protein [Oculatella sp. FACHB-28]MBD2058062.1 Tab2/Atab2 family RNA-binding protein [Oculatella sp. FACHB-28]
MPVIWELDFYSRPVLDENDKKLWEVLICESPTDITTEPDSLFRYAKFCSNSEVNSVTLRESLEEAIAQAAKPPSRIRFFRRQMANMITKGCEDAGITAFASRRTLAINQWIEQRMQEVYPTYPTYQPGTNPSVAMADNAPQPLPDALIGQQWAFVNLEAIAFKEMPEWEIGFGEAFPLEMAGLAPDARVPGLIIFSPRAVPLAGWMSGLELAFLKFNTSPPQLVLETGADNAWILINLPTPALQAEAKAFEIAKQQANQVHFIAVQTDPESETFAGFWLLQELNLA